MPPASAKCRIDIFRRSWCDGASWVPGCPNGVQRPRARESGESDEAGRARELVRTGMLGKQGRESAGGDCQSQGQGEP